MRLQRRIFFVDQHLFRPRFLALSMPLCVSLDGGEGDPGFKQADSQLSGSSRREINEEGLGSVQGGIRSSVLGSGYRFAPQNIGSCAFYDLIHVHTASQSIHGYGTFTNHHTEKGQTRDMLACIQSTEEKNAAANPPDTDFEEVLQAALGVSSESIPAWSLCRYRFIPQSSTEFVSNML